MNIQSYIRILILIVGIIPISKIYAQSVQDIVEKARVLIDGGKYGEGYKILQGVNEGQLNEYGDSCKMLYNYEIGTCLYFTKRYKEAIPHLKTALLIMEKKSHEDCDYLEMLYGIGSCYKKLGNYPKAEEYYRKVILKGTYFGLNCAIRNQTYSDMAELYNMMGKPEYADICTSRIESEIRIRDSKDLDTQIDDLLDLYNAYDKQGKVNESVDVLKRILHLIDENKGKNNKDYLSYSYLLGARLRYNCNRPQEAALVHKEMIEIGKLFKTNRNEICSAYIEYLRYLSENNKVDSIELILPVAVKYYFSTKDKRYEENLYELVGNGLCDAKNYEEGIKYLEKKWEGQSANSIKALDYLGAYYFYRKNNVEKALGYYENAEAQIEGGLETNLGTKILVLERLVLINQRLGRNNNAVLFSEKLEHLLKQENDDDKYSLFIIDWCIECVNTAEIEKAKELTERAESFLDKVSVNTKIILLSQLGFVYIKIGQYDISISNINKGIELAIKETGKKAPILETLYHNLGRAYMLKEDYHNALSALNKSKSLQMELEGEVSQRTADYIKECESK